MRSSQHTAVSAAAGPMHKPEVIQNPRPAPHTGDGRTEAQDRYNPAQSEPQRQVQPFPKAVFIAKSWRSATVSITPLQTLGKALSQRQLLRHSRCLYASPTDGTTPSAILKRGRSVSSQAGPHKIANLNTWHAETGLAAVTLKLRFISFKMRKKVATKQLHMLQDSERIPVIDHSSLNRKLRQDSGARVLTRRFDDKCTNKRSLIWRPGTPK